LIHNALLIYNPVLSTRIRSQVPAPINTVHTHPAAAGNEPITVLFIPLVIALPASEPIAIFPPVVEEEL
jgi:hypothetical protein